MNLRFIALSSSLFLGLSVVACGGDDFTDSPTASVAPSGQAASAGSAGESGGSASGGSGGQLSGAGGKTASSGAGGATGGVTGVGGNAGAGAGESVGGSQPADKEPPKLVKVTPEAGFIGLTSTEVTLEFSEPLKLDSLEAAVFGATSMTLSEDKKVLTLDRSVPFADKEQKLELKVKGTITDLAGNALGDDLIVTHTFAPMKRVALELKTWGHLAGGSVYSFLQVGDAYDDTKIFGGARFDTTPVPGASAPAQFRSATLSGRVGAVTGAPNVPVRVERFNHGGDLKTLLNPELVVSKLGDLFDTLPSAEQTFALDISEAFGSFLTARTVDNPWFDLRLSTIVNPNKKSDLIRFRRFEADADALPEQVDAFLLTVDYWDLSTYM